MSKNNLKKVSKSLNFSRYYQVHVIKIDIELNTCTRNQDVDILHNHVDLDYSKAIHAKEEKRKLVTLRKIHITAYNKFKLTLDFYSSVHKMQFVILAW